MMKQKWKEIIFVLTFAVVIPTLILAQVEPKPDAFAETTAATAADTQTTAALPDVLRLPVLMEDGSVVELELEDYITSVVLREMPADFEMEALKAQAVVARTYALRRQRSGGKHAEAAVCTDPSCCQGFRDQEAYLAEGGSQELLEKVRQAVTDTAGYVLTYEGELAEATYFSCSGGMTEDAEAVWGADVPYLQATESPGEEAATHYMDTVTFTAQEFAERLGGGFTGLPGSWIGHISYTQGGGVESIVICGTEYTGTKLRQLLGLRSTAFVITVVGDAVTVTTKGFGHRVGMSQYGADAMAVNGSTFDQILSHYYKGTTLSLYSA